MAIRRASRQACAIRSRHCVALLAALAWSAAAAQAPEDRLRALESEVQSLKQRVDALEGRQVTVPAPAPAAAGCPGWERLRLNMTEAEVRGVLGVPAKIETTPLQSRWRYPCGTAYFDIDTKRFVGYER